MKEEILPLVLLEKVECEHQIEYLIARLHLTAFCVSQIPISIFLVLKIGDV